MIPDTGVASIGRTLCSLNFAPDNLNDEPHAQWHEHKPLRHANPHVPDMHHRNDH
jgi:hypothetical protein